ncbi:MAG: 4Fe-4S binding protein [Syntrophobacter sp.]
MVIEEVYRELARKLDSFPQGFPAARNGLELDILRWIFTPAEAAIAIDLSPAPEPVSVIAERLGKSEEATEAILDDMRLKCQTLCLIIGGKHCYLLPPFFPGFHEGQVVRPDKTIEERREYTRMYEEYYPQLLKTLGGFAPALTRVVPVSAAVEPGLRIHRIDDVRRIIEASKSIFLMECVCRKEKALYGQTCKHSLEVCMALSDQEEMLSNWPYGRVIPVEEAIEVAIKAEKEGLVHTTYNADESGVTFLCACCPCCSGFLSGLAKYKAPYIVTRSNFVAWIDETTCERCGICANERCPMGAIEEHDGYRVEPKRCIGCGVCTSTCPTGAIRLIRMPDSELESLPSGMGDWAVQRMGERGM